MDTSITLAVAKRAYRNARGVLNDAARIDLDGGAWRQVECHWYLVGKSHALRTDWHNNNVHMLDCASLQLNADILRNMNN